jgi:hypothetical protein
MFSVRSIQFQIESDIPHAFRLASSAGFHFAARRTQDFPIAIRVGIRERVLAQIFFSDTRFVGTGGRRWERTDFAGHGDFPEARFDIQRVEAAREKHCRPE